MTAPDGYSKGEPLPPPGPGAADRGLAAFRSLLRACGFNPILFCPIDCKVDSVIDETTVEVSPLDHELGVPGGIAAKLTPGIDGARVVPVVGSRVVLVFLDGNQSKPIIVGGDPDTPPSHIKFAGGGKAVARVDDTTVNGTITGANTGGAVTFTYTPAGGAPVISTSISITGKIDSGSTKLESG